MKIDILINCTICFLELLVVQYNLKRINPEFFAVNSKLKVEFLNENIDNINCSKEKEHAANVLETCERILI